MRKGIVALLLLVAPMLMAADYTVDPGDGPLTLHADVEAAVLAWRNAAPSVSLEEGAGAERVILWGDPDLMGPDLVTLTVQQPGEPRPYRVLVHTELAGDWPAALMHEVGLLLGAPSGSAGIMNPALSADTPEEPTSADVTALTSARSQVRGDLNGDGVVDWLDLLALASEHGRRGLNLAADLDGDGVVTDEDLRMLREELDYSFTVPGSREPVVEQDAEAPEQPEPELEEVPDPAAPPAPMVPGDSAGPGD